MKRILILTNNDIGLYRFRKELIERLLKRDKVIISLPNGEYIQKFVNIGCKFIDTDISRRGTNPVTDFKLLLKYLKMIRDVKPDIVLTYTIKPNVYGGLACQMLGIPYIANITGLGTAVENEGLLQKVALILYKLGLRKSKTIFFQNEENMNFMQRYNIGKKNGKLIPGSGVNLNHFILQEYPTDETIEFVFISRIMKQKGIDQYIETAQYIKKKYSTTKFHICGFCEEEYEEKLDSLHKEGVVEYHGMVKDVREILKRTHCTIHPTYYPEGMSNVLLESAASGRPIITTNRSGCREIIDNGINGYIVEQKNSADLIKKVERFMELSHEEKKQMGLEGRKKVEREFDRRIVVNAYIEEIKKM